MAHLCKDYGAYGVFWDKYYIWYYDISNRVIRELLISLIYIFIYLKVSKLLQLLLGFT